MADNKVKRSYRVSIEADELMDTLAYKFGLSKTDILEMSIRYFAQYQGVETEQQVLRPLEDTPDATH